MAEYAERFAENDIDINVLPDLTDQHLKDLGVSLGHRLKMLRAIRELARAAPATPQSPAVTEPVARGAERRQLTVMFCDLVGSTALSARFDPEDLREIIGGYHQRCAEVIAKAGGFVAKYMGDGVLAYFGYPRAHEDDAERAVRAGLEAIAAVSALKSRAPLQMRVGIATGLVVVGDLIGSGEAQERGIVGETPNLAARLQAIADPDAVVIADGTRKLLGNLFDLQDLGPCDLKGLGGPMRAWMALRPSTVESRFEALHAAGLTALIGREEEIDLLLRRWKRAKIGEGQVVLLSGEPGIGKSRLAVALLDRIGIEPHTYMRYFCSPHHSQSALHPLIQRLERAAGFEPGDEAPARLDRLDALLAQTAASAEDAAIFAELLSLPGSDRYPRLDLTPQQRRKRTIEAILRRLDAMASQQPVFAIFEDVHWIDPTSLEVLSRMVERVRKLNVLLVVTFRPEFDPPWAGQSHVTVLMLNRLGPHDCRDLLKGIVGNKELSGDVVDEIIARTDGVPLFVEELTKAVVEAGTIAAARDELAAIPTSPLVVPATLHASLMARLDRLGPAKEVAQIGAAMGREFSYELVSAVARCSEPELADALDRLTDASLLFREGTPPHATFLFKHALIQDAAYGTLLREARRDLHARIAKTLDENFPETRDTQPEILAHHYTEAGLTEAAMEWRRKAGDRALRRSAFVEAIAHLGKAIGLAEGAADESSQRLLRLQLQIAYGQAVMNARGYGAPETTAAFARARELAAGIEDAAERYSAYYGAWASTYVRGELAPMRELAEEFLRDAACRPELPEAGVAHRVFGGTCWFQGDFVTARRHLEQALAGYDPERDRSLAFRFGQDVVVSAMINLAHVLWPLGELERARRLVEEALTRAMQSAHVPTMAYGQYYKCLFEAVARDAARATPHADALVGLSREHGLPFFLTSGTFYHGWTRWHAGHREAGTAEMRRGIALAREHGIGLTMPLYGLLLAEAEAEAGRVEAGLISLENLLPEIERTGQRWFEAEVNRLRGELLLRREPPGAAAAEAAFIRAIEIARNQQTRTFELRAALSLAKFYQATGRGQAAHELLVPALVGFSDGPELPEVGESLRLLRSLDQISGVV
jgi:class 3 adenylate cyclase/predicted ATPase